MTPRWIHRLRPALLLFPLVFLFPAAPGPEAAAAAKKKAGEAEPPPDAASLSVLRSEMSYCQVGAIDGTNRRLIENEWAFTAGPHLIHLDCRIESGSIKGLLRSAGGLIKKTNVMHFGYDMVFEPQPRRLYLIKDFADPGDQAYIWIEDVDTKEVVSGGRPAVFEGPDRYTDEEIAEAIEALGKGATLVIDYTAPKKPVKRFEVRIKNLVVLETSGNEDYRTEIPIAPGYYILKVAVENDKEHADFSSQLDLDLEPGQTRTLTVKGKPWGRSPARIK